MSNGLRAAVIGANGYAGGEVCRLLLNHPHVESISPVARGDVSFEYVHQNLLGCGLEFSKPDEVIERANSYNVIFFCASPGVAMKMAPTFLKAGARVIDLGPDFRFQDAELFQKTYGFAHAAADYLPEAVYGVSELYRNKIRSARLIANPGCYVITVLLALRPLLDKPMIDLAQLVSIFAINGTTGAGSEAKVALMHANVHDNILAYSMDGHRHAPELEDQLQRIAGRKIAIDLTTSHGSFRRGICVQMSLPVLATSEVCRPSLIELFKNFYGSNASGEQFVKVNSCERTGGKNAKDYDIYSKVARVAGSNYCHISLDFDSVQRRIKVISVIDNLGKGAAGSAVQNMNLMFDLPESEGIKHYGL